MTLAVSAVKAHVKAVKVVNTVMIAMVHVIAVKVEMDVETVIDASLVMHVKDVMPVKVYVMVDV